MSRPALGIESFNAILTQEPRPLVVGGQAVSIWAKTYVGDDLELQKLQPFLSKDCDLYGNADTLQALARATGWALSASPKGQASPVVGFLTGKDSLGNDLSVEVLFSVKGLDERDLTKDTVVRIGDSFYRTLSPITLLKAKLANAFELPQETPAGKRNDLKHISILIRCVAGYLREAHEKLGKGEITERGMVNMLETTLSLVESGYARRIAQIDGSRDLRHCFPACIQTSPFPKVQNFYQRRLASKTNSDCPPPSS